MSAACVECEKRGCPTEGMTVVCEDGQVRCAGHAHLGGGPMKMTNPEERE